MMKKDLERTRLGRSNLEVSRIAFGTWQLGGDWGATDEDAAVAAIRHAAATAGSSLCGAPVRPSADRPSSQ